jgi:hypothetical protein
MDTHIKLNIHTTSTQYTYATSSSLIMHLRTTLARLVRWGCAAGKTEALGQFCEDFDAVVSSREELLARAHCEDGDVSERVDTLVVLNWEGTVEQDAARGVCWVDIVVGGAVCSLGRHTRSVLVDGPVLAAVGVGHQTLEEGVAGVPVGWEVAVGVGQIAGVDVLRETRLLVGTDGITLLAVDVLGSEVGGINGTHDIETVTVVSGDEDKSLLEAVGFVEVLDGGLDSVVKLEQFTESTVIVKDMHHLVDRRCLAHQEPTILTRACLKDINGLEGHLLETGLVESGSLVTSRGERLVQVLAVDVTVQPLSHVGGAEDTQGLLCYRGGEHGSAVQEDLVALLGELGVVILALVCDTSERRRIELLGTTTEDDINGSLGPGVVLDTVEESVDNSSILRSRTGMSDQSSGSSIGNVSGGDDSNVATSETVEHLSKGLDLGVVESVGAGISVDVQAVDGALVSSVEGRSRVGRISDEAVKGVGHLMSKNRELVHGHGGLVLSVNALVSDQAGGRDHVGGHTITNEKDDVLGLALLCERSDGPCGLGLAAVVVVEGGGVCAGLVKSNAAVSLGGYIDERWLLRVTGKEVWNPSAL